MNRTMGSGLTTVCIVMLIIFDLFAYWAATLLHYPVPPFWRAVPTNLILIITFYTDHCTLY